MPTIKLSYFDFDGGRGEVARLALSIGGVAFDDDRVSLAEWPRRKPTLPFAALPTLQVDGETVAQSNAINRYVGRLAQLYPGDPWQAALCDEAMDAVEDASIEVGRTFSIKDEDEKKAARLALAEGPLPRFLTALGGRLEQRGTGYFSDGRLTVADLKVFLWVRHLRSGNLDYLPADLPDRLAPALVAHFERINSHPGVAAYYASRK